jgi:hypothetical protein
MSLDTGNNIIITEFIDNVFNIQLGSAAGLGSLFQTVELLCLSTVDTDTDNFVVKILLQPGNRKKWRLTTSRKNRSKSLPVPSRDSWSIIRITP